MGLLIKFIKFGLVGFIGLIIDFSFTYLFKEKLKLNRYISNSIGFTIAASSNYIFNRLWTFHSHNPEVATEFLSFLIVSIVGLLINNFCIYLFEKRFNFYFSKVLAIGVTTFWNFFANYWITFNL
jgi:putative flippase GtrA